MSVAAFRRLARAKALQQTSSRQRTAYIHHFVHTASPRPVRFMSAGKITRGIIPPDEEPPEVRAAEIERRLQELGIEYTVERDSQGVARSFHYLVGAESVGPDGRIDQLLFAFGLEPITTLDESADEPSTSDGTRDA